MSDLAKAQLYLGKGPELWGIAENGKIKWARCQGAVTLPWPRAHSILKWIGGDISMLRRAVEMSRRNPDNPLLFRALRIFGNVLQLAENREDENSNSRSGHH
jgi:hypothetical protein